MVWVEGVVGAAVMEVWRGASLLVVRALLSSARLSCMAERSRGKMEGMTDTAICLR